MELGISRVDQEFREFIISLLKLGGLTDKRITEFTDEDSMRQFRIAFIHKSYESEDNYELAEFLGDTVVNNCLAFYLKRRFPEISSNTFITSLKHKYQSKTELYEIAKNENFLAHILYGKEMQDIVRSRNPGQNEKYRSMLEDTFEAFIGTVVIVIDSKTRNGVGNPIACNIISSLTSKIDISLEQKAVYTGKQILKEVFDKPLDWDIKQEFKTIRLGPAEWEATIYGYPALIRKGKLHPIPPEQKPLKHFFWSEREIMAREYGPDPTTASNKAANKVLEILANDFNIHYGKKEISESKKTEIPQLIVTTGFKNLIEHLLKLGRVKEKELGKFTDKKSLFKFRYSFIHKSYAGKEISGLSKFLGDVVVDNCIAFYLKKRFPEIINVNYLTRLKHNISKDGFLGLSVESTGILKYILYGEDWKKSIEGFEDPHNSEKYIKLLKGVFSSFIGTMVTIINEKTIDGAGYVVAYNIIFHFLNKKPIPLDYEKVFQPHYRLKEVYDKLKWEINKEIKRTENDDKTWTTVYYGYPFGDRKKGTKREILGEAIGRNKKKATEKAALKALENLKLYGIHEIKGDPYKKN